MSTDLTPGHAVVTGATGGIGQAIVQRLLDAGWRVTGPVSYTHLTASMSS